MKYSKTFKATGEYPYYDDNIRILGIQIANAKRELINKIAKQLIVDEELNIIFNQNVDIDGFKANTFSLELNISILN